MAKAAPEVTTYRVDPANLKSSAYFLSVSTLRFMELQGGALDVGSCGGESRVVLYEMAEPSARREDGR